MATKHQPQKHHSPQKTAHHHESHGGAKPKEEPARPQPRPKAPEPPAPKTQPKPTLQEDLEAGRGPSGNGHHHIDPSAPLAYGEVVPESSSGVTPEEKAKQEESQS